MNDYKIWLRINEDITNKCIKYINHFAKIPNMLEFEEDSVFDKFEIKGNYVIITYKDKHNPYDFNFIHVPQSSLDDIGSHLKNCYICIPISGKEDDLKQRYLKAREEVVKLGYNPILPPDIDKALESNDFSIKEIAKFMAKDIEMLIGYCEAIYICKDWETSKGCKTEVACAEAYDKLIIYQ